MLPRVLSTPFYLLPSIIHHPSSIIVLCNLPSQPSRFSYSCSQFPRCSFPYPAQLGGSAAAHHRTDHYFHHDLTQRQLPEIGDSTSQAFCIQTIPIFPQIINNSGGSRLTFASPPPTGLHHDSYDQKGETDGSIPSPNPVITWVAASSLECEGRQPGLNRPSFRAPRN